MSIKLFTMGDSISQGFMSGAAANTHKCYSTIIAALLNIKDYKYNKYTPEYKLGLDLELILRTLENKYGNDIEGLEAIGSLASVAKIFDKAEDYFERGEGKIGIPLNEPEDFYHNIALEGMNIADAWLVTPQHCRDIINKERTRDNLFGIPSHGFYRNAYRILNPNAKVEFENFTPLDWLEYHSNRSGIENTVLWLGTNNALGTILDLKVIRTEGDFSILDKTREARLNYNLWHPNDFKEEYSMLLDKAVDALRNNRYKDWHCYLGTIPLVTIVPIINGIGNEIMAGEYKYYQYYTYQPLTHQTAMSTGKYLEFTDALLIDSTITEFNNIIVDLVKKKNIELGREALHITDISKSLTQMAWKRNSEKPTYNYPKALTETYPLIHTKYYHVNRSGEIECGGIFSLDGVHPTYTGQGIIAYEFLKTMKKCGQVPEDIDINWKTIRAGDSFQTAPIKLMPELYEHEKLIELCIKVMNHVN